MHPIYLRSRHRTGINYGVHWERWHKTTQVWKNYHPFAITPKVTECNQNTPWSAWTDISGRHCDHNRRRKSPDDGRTILGLEISGRSSPDLWVSGHGDTLCDWGGFYEYSESDKTVICIDGDGSFNMSLHDLRTIAEYDLPIKIFVMNDNSLSTVKAWEQLYYGDRYVATSLENNPDYVRLAKSFGIPSLLCRDAFALESTMNLALRTKALSCGVSVDMCAHHWWDQDPHWMTSLTLW